MSLKWIAKHLEMGAPAHVAHLLYRQGQSVGAYENTLTPLKETDYGGKNALQHY